MRGQLRALAETGVVERRRRDDFPGSLDLELTESGRELWAVAQVLAAWLQTAPDGPLPLGSAAAKSAIKALVEGWSTSIVRALAARPLSLTELNDLISGLSYPSLERRLGAMRLCGQIERVSGRGRSVPYTATAWLRQAIAPLSAAARWEQLRIGATAAPIRRLDVEAAFLLVMPLLDLEGDVSGTSRLAVEVGGANGSGLAGVLVSVGDGEVTSCVAKMQGNADAWAIGSAPAWLQAVIEEDTGRLEVGGDGQLVRALLTGLHGALFGKAWSERPPQ
jgi:DNA-binding HxlR family transcriptional regulator